MARRKGKTRTAGVQEFLDKQVLNVIPYGLDDLAVDDGCVSVGSDHDNGG